MRVRADGQEAPLDVEYCGPIPETIQTDPTRLRQILINLVGNAIKFTETRRRSPSLVAMRFRDTAEPRLQCEVIDTGVGMSREQIGLVFQPFRKPTPRPRGGSAARAWAGDQQAPGQMLGGDITARACPARGARSCCTIATGPLEGVRHAGSASTRPSRRRAARSTPATAALAPADGRILLAEDGPDNQRLIAFILRRRGAEVEIGENGQKAMEKRCASGPAATIGQQPFDVILMDMQMPVMDGYEATRQLRQQGYTGPILALTAHAMKGDRRNAWMPVATTTSPSPSIAKSCSRRWPATCDPHPATRPKKRGLSEGTGRRRRTGRRRIRSPASRRCSDAQQSFTPRLGNIIVDLGGHGGNVHDESPRLRSGLPFGGSEHHQRPFRNHKHDGRDNAHGGQDKQQADRFQRLPPRARRIGGIEV